jgi:hypothetical protein
LTAWSTLTHHPSLSAFAGSFVLVFYHDGSIYQGFQVIVGHSYQVGLQFFLKSIQETLPLLLVSVDVIWGIPSPSGEFVKVLSDTYPTLLEVEKLVAHDLDEYGGNMSLAELGLEGFPSNY